MVYLIHILVKERTNSEN